MTSQTPEERPNIEEWEKEFDRDIYTTFGFVREEPKKIKNFIHHQLQKAREEERKMILQIVNDVELSYAVNDGRDTSEMFGGQMAACEIRRKINSDIVNQEVNN